MVDHARAARLAKRIQTIVANAIELEVKDSRLELVTAKDHGWSARCALHANVELQPRHRARD